MILMPNLCLFVGQDSLLLLVLWHFSSAYSTLANSHSNTHQKQNSVHSMNRAHSQTEKNLSSQGKENILLLLYWFAVICFQFAWCYHGRITLIILGSISLLFYQGILFYQWVLSSSSQLSICERRYACIQYSVPGTLNLALNRLMNKDIWVSCR